MPRRRAAAATTTIVEAHPQRADDLDAGIGRSKRQPVAEAGLGELQKYVATGGIDPPHAPEVGAQVAPLDEIGERRLQEERRELAGYPERQPDALEERHGQDHEAEPEGREEELGEGAEIDDPIGPVDALHRRHRPALKAILAVEIVLDDPGVQPLRDIEKAKALFHAHGDAERKLTGRRDVDHAGRISRMAGRAPNPRSSTWSGCSRAPAATKAAWAP